MRTTIISGTRMRVLLNDQQIVPASGWLEVGSEVTSGSGSFRVWNIPAGHAWWVDDITVRPYIEGEPTTTVGAQQLKP